MDKPLFSDLDVDANILKAIEEMGFVHPTEIQEQAIPYLLDTDGDFVGQAQTGTGKTAAFVIPLLEKIDPTDGGVQALILSPTRELAMQIESEIKKLSKYTGIRSTSIYGGTGYEKQLRALKKDNPQIVVGTPGRVIDMIKRGALKLGNAQFLVLDEADEMLNMGFFEDVQLIVEMFNPERQMIMFSATMPKSILGLIKKSCSDYHMVKIEKKTLSNADIEQRYFVVPNKYHREALARLIDYSPDIYAMVFCRTKVETKEVGQELRDRGYNVEILNGDMGQADRDISMRNFKSKKANIMVCTDVAARGIDVNNLTHVFNYGLPQDNESYVHRIGRTGRAGMKGKAYTILGPKMAFAMKKIGRHVKTEIELERLPTVDKLKENLISKEMEQLNRIINSVQSRGEEFSIDETYDVFKQQLQEVSQEELMKAIFTWKFNQTLQRYNALSKIDVPEKDQTTNLRGGDSEGGRRKRSRGSRRRGSDRGERRSSDRGERRGSDRGERRGSDRGEGRGRSDKSDRREERFNQEDRESKRRSKRGERMGSERRRQASHDSIRSMYKSKKQTEEEGGRGERSFSKSSGQPLKKKKSNKKSKQRRR